VVFHNQDALIALAAVAGATSQVRLGASVLLGTLRPPLLFAKMIASLDQLSGGRLIVGLGVGSRADDFAAVDVPLERRGPRLSEHIRVAQQAWTGMPIHHAGTFYHYDVGPVGPSPVQQPHPPIWLGGSAEGALRRAGRLGNGYIAGSSRGPAGARANWEKVQQYAQAAGRDPSLVTFAALVFACVDEDHDRAMEVAGDYMLRYYGARQPNMSIAELVGPHHLIGPADECVRKAQAYVDAGVEVLIIGSVSADLRYLDRLCEQVLPRIARHAAV
jgi:probable F420-dependent oxidoreductase